MSLDWVRTDRDVDNFFAGMRLRVLEEMGEDIRPPSYVYFIGCRGCRNIKIGYTGNLDHRLKTLKREHDRDCFDPQVELIGFFEGARNEERFLHRAWAHLRLVNLETGRPTEWFVVDEEAAACIDLMAYAGAVSFKEKHERWDRKWQEALSNEVEVAKHGARP